MSEESLQDPMQDPNDTIGADDPLSEVSAIMTELVTKIDQFSTLGLDQARIINRTRNKLKEKVRVVIENLKMGEMASRELETLKINKSHNVIDLERQISDLKSKLAFLNGDLAMAKYEVSELEKRVSDLEDIRLNLSELLSSSRNETDNLAKELDELKKASS